MLVGRDAELARVRDLVDEGVPVAISGPAGIGKTSLACAALEPGPFRQAGALATLAWSPLLVFARLLRRRPPEGPEAVATAALRDGRSPVLVDDLQWADDTSLEVLGLLRDRIPLVVTVRTGEERSGHVLGVMELLGAELVELTGLPADEARSLSRHHHPDLDDDARDLLLEAAGGNPLLLAELPVAGATPTTLVSALLARVEGLTPAARRALVRLAVLGRPAPADLLGPGADRLVGTGLVVETDGGLIVRHPLLAEVVVEGLGAEAVDVHRDLAGRVGDGEAAHLLLAAGDRPGARARALRAAEQGDRRTQAEMLTLAVGCAPDLDVANRIRAARLHTATGQPDRARRLCAVEGVDALAPLDRGGLRAAEAEAAWLQGRAQECAELLEKALPDLEGTGTAAEVLALAGSTVLHTFVDLDGRPVLDRARRAVGLADEIGEEQGYARSRLASVLLTAGEDGWAELYAEVIAGAEAAGDRELRGMAITSLVLGHWVQGDTRRAEALARREVARGPAEEVDSRWLALAAYAALLGLQVGRDRRALVEEFGPLLDEWPVFGSRAFMEAAVALARADAGDHAAAAAGLAGGRTRASPDPQSQAIVLWAEVEAAWLAGRADDCTALVADVDRLGVGDYPPALQARLVAGHAAREAGSPPPGSAPASTLPAWRPAAAEWAALAAWADGDLSAAADRFAAAAEDWEGADVRSALRCAWAGGDAAARAGAPDGAERLRAVEARAAAGGFVALAARARRSLRATGAPGRAATSAGPGGLTGREAEVLELVGAGLTSAQIGAALGIRPSTVDGFAASAARRLGVSGRRAAAARLRDLRLDEEDGLSGP